jgi:hypothetical protein
MSKSLEGLAGNRIGARCWQQYYNKACQHRVEMKKTGKAF